MIKRILFLVLLSSSLFAKTYNFSENRYSYAFDSSIVLDGIISFEHNTLKINYENTKREILYQDSLLQIKEDNEVIPMDEMEVQRVSAFFKILLLVYSNDSNALSEKFYMKKQKDGILLLPKEELARYIKKIILKKEKEQLKIFQLFLQNDDTITISIKNEIP